jgi:hypothetical protein
MASPETTKIESPAYESLSDYLKSMVDHWSEKYPGAKEDFYKNPIENTLELLRKELSLAKNDVQIKALESLIKKLEDYTPAEPASATPEAKVTEPKIEALPDFTAIDSWSALEDALDAHGSITTATQTYTPEILKGIIHKIRTQNLPLSFLTDQGGLRNVVAELIKKEKNEKPAPEILFYGKELDDLDLGSGFVISYVKRGPTPETTFVTIDIPATFRKKGDSDQIENITLTELENLTIDGRIDEPKMKEFLGLNNRIPHAEKARTQAMEEYAKAYKEYYANKGTLSKLWGEALAATGYGSKEDSLATLDETEEGEKLIDAKYKYYREQEAYIRTKREQIKRVANRHAEQINYFTTAIAAEEAKTPPDTALIDKMKAAKDDLEKRLANYDIEAAIEKMSSKYVAITAVAEKEALLRKAQEEAFETQTKTVLKKVTSWYTDQPWYVKTAISSAIVGSVAATIAAVGTASLAGAAGSGLFMAGRGIAGAFLGKKAGAWLNKTGAGQEAGAVATSIAAMLPRALTGGLAGVAGGFIGRGIAAGLEKVLVKKNPEEALAELEAAYNKGDLSYQNYMQGKQEIEEGAKAWATTKSVGMIAGAMVGGGAISMSDNLQEINDSVNIATGEYADALGNDVSDLGENIQESSLGEKITGAVTKVRGVFTGEESEAAVLSTDAEVLRGEINDNPTVLRGEITTEEVLSGDIETETTPQVNISETTSSSEWGEVPQNAKVQSGDGITNIFNRQLQSDPELLATAEEELGMDYESNRGVFLAKLAQKFGYINADGTADVRLHMNANNAYELDIQGGSLVVNEWENGQINETNTFGSVFEVDTDDGIDTSREYVNTSTNEGAGVLSGDINTNGSVLRGEIGTDSTTLSGEIGTGTNISGSINFDNASLSGEIGTDSSSIDNKTTPEELFNQNNEPTTLEDRVSETRDKHFDLKNKGWEIEGGRKIFYENTLANWSAKEVFEHMRGYEQGDFAIKDSKLEALIPYMNEIYHDIEARGINWQTWPDNITFDQATYIAEGGNYEHLLGATLAESGTPQFNAFDYDKVYDIVNSSEVFTADQATASLSFLKETFGEYRFNQFMNVPIGQLGGVVEVGSFAEAPQALFKQVVEKMYETAKLTVTPDMKIGDVLNTSLTAMGATTNVDEILAATN